MTLIGCADAESTGADAGGGQPAACASPEATPAGLGYGAKDTLEVFARLADACVVVDGERLSNAQIAMSIAAAHDGLERMAAGSSAGIPPSTSTVWLRFGIAAAVAKAAAGSGKAPKGDEFADWFAGYLHEHSVSVSGVAVRTEELPRLLVPPSCEDIPACSTQLPLVP